jgi:serine/threonine protein kinase
MRLVDCLQQLHDHGYVHCDIKLANVVLESSDLKSLASSNLILIDYGLSQSWRQTNNEHVRQKNIGFFSGNYQFASHNAFRHVTQSRRDDMISLAYLMYHLLTKEFWPQNTK